MALTHHVVSAAVEMAAETGEAVEPVDVRAAAEAPGRGAPGEPHPRRRLIFAIVSMALFMSSIDQTIVATALSSIQHELHAAVNWSSWSITIYALGQVLAMPVVGKMSDQFGRKRIFLLSAVVFTASSLACGFANSIYMLVALRAIQALGGGAFMPSASGIVSDHFGRDRDRALGMFTSIMPIGGVVGPILGGVFVAYWSWRGIFLVNVPIGVALILLGWWFVPHSARRPSAHIDLRGVALFGVAILTAMFGITYLGTGRNSPLSPGFLGPEFVAVVACVAFLWHTGHDAAPFIPSRLLHGRGFGVMNLINFLYGSAALGFSALVPLYAQDRFGISILGAGTLLTARAIGMICVAGLAVMALRRTGYRPPMVVGFVIVAVGLWVMALSPRGMSDYAWLALAAGVTGVGMGLSVPASNNAILQLAPDQVAAIAGLRGMFRQSGSIMAVSITTALLARSRSPGMTQAHVFMVFAILLACVLPLVWLVPEHRGSW